MTTAPTSNTNALCPSDATKFEIVIGNHQYSCARPHHFGLVIYGPLDPLKPQANLNASDYLHQQLLSPSVRDTFLNLVQSERLVVCKNVTTQDPTYRKVRGKSSSNKLSQAEYYHHDGCSCPTKPRIVEIRLPHQDIDRSIATAIAPFKDIVMAMLTELPDGLKPTPALDSQLMAWAQARTEQDRARYQPPPESWDKIQGRITRAVRKEMDAESCRAWFRRIDLKARAYALPWEMGESRLMLNHVSDLTLTMQHRRSMQKSKSQDDQNGSLVKRWTAEEYPGVNRP